MILHVVCRWPKCDYVTHDYTYKWIELKWEPRNKPIRPQTSDVWQGQTSSNWVKKGLFNKWCWLFTSRAMKLDPYLTAHTEINSKYLTGLNVVGEINSQRKHESSWLWILQKAQAMKEKIDEISSQLKPFVHQKKLSGEWIDSPQNGTK